VNETPRSTSANLAAPGSGV